jgi:hypothetical protein
MPDPAWSGKCRSCGRAAARGRLFRVPFKEYPMYRSTVLGSLLAFLGLAAWLVSAPAPPPESKPEPLPSKLAKPVKFDGWDADPKMTFQEALDALAKDHGLTFNVNEAAFRTEMVDDVLIKPVAERAMPKMNNATLSTLLQKLLARIPCSSGTAYLLRRNVIEITTFAAVRSEVWGADYPGPFLPLVSADLQKRPLDEALKELADQADFNVLLDPRAGEKAKAAVTARLANMPLDTAVRLLANMAELKSYQVDNVLYVTTPENAARMEEEKQKAAQANDTPPRLGSGRSMVPMPPAGM